MHRATSPFVAGEYAVKGMIQQYQFLRGKGRVWSLWGRDGVVVHLRPACCGLSRTTLRKWAIFWKGRYGRRESDMAVERAA
jgi:hypothetical protein